MNLSYDEAKRCDAFFVFKDQNNNFSQDFPGYVMIKAIGNTYLWVLSN
jgi:hypothetical protein